MARPRAHDYKEKQVNILSTAVKLFARYGFTGAFINMIAKACGMSKALLYHYYPDKEALLFAILSNHLTDLIVVVATSVTQPQTSQEKALAIASTLLNSYKNADAEHQVQISSLKLLSQKNTSTINYQRKTAC